MKIAYLDTIAGISGDMTLGAFISAGISFDELVHELNKLPVKGYELQARHVERNGITATKIDVDIHAGEQPHRHLSDINRMLDQSALNDSVRERAKGIFLRLAEAEARVHNTTIEKVHFHEVGALDALIDVVGTSICVDLMGIEAVYSSPVKVGRSGFVKAEHGLLPVPTPATMEILKGYPILFTEIDAELTTPTGAAIVSTLSRGMLPDEAFRIDAIGYGAGTREFEDVPNLFRIMIGSLSTAFERDQVVALETNIDDMNPELYPYVMERLFDAGALDAYIVPLIMKKGRPGILLGVLARPSEVNRIETVLFSETSTLGIRSHRMDRKTVARREQEFMSSFGPVRVKVITKEGNNVMTPEYEECRRIAVERGIPIQEVYLQLEKEFRS